MPDLKQMIVAIACGLFFAGAIQFNVSAMSPLTSK
jgi:hypothetical protein